MVRRRIASAAAVIMLGTLTTSLLGFVRAFVVARYFGAGTNTDAFFAALVVPQMFYDQLIGGAIAAVLIPTFTRLADQDHRALWRVVGAVYFLVALVLAGVVIVLEIAAPLLMRAIASGFATHAHGDALPLSVKLVRILLPVLLFMGLSAVSLAVLYSLHRRIVASFATGCYHLGIIVAAIFGSGPLGIVALPIGALVGGALQFLTQIPALLNARRSSGMRLVSQLRLDLQNPTVRLILKLYAPVALGMCVSIAGQVADVNFKSHLPEQGGLSSMQYATQLVQFPIGIIVAGLGFAVLPAISSDAAVERWDAFKETLSLGFRLVILVMVPAAVGFLLLATPIVALLFERGHFHHTDTIHTASALMGYAPQLPLVGIDQLLIFGFYARHNTVTPVLAGVAGVCVYVVMAAILLVPLTIVGLAIANTVQIGAHAAILLVLLVRSIGPLPGSKMWTNTAKIGIATAVMAAAIVLTQRWLPAAQAGISLRLVAVGLPVLAAVAVYGTMLAILRVEEASIAWQSLRLRLSEIR